MIDKQDRKERLLNYINGGYAPLKVAAVVENSLSDDKDFESMFQLLKDFEGTEIADEYDNAQFRQLYDAVYYADKLSLFPAIKRYDFNRQRPSQIDVIIDKHFAAEIRRGEIIVLANDDDYKEQCLNLPFSQFQFEDKTELSVFHSCGSILIETCKIASCRIYFTVPKEVYRALIN